ncbi:hypothetical protein [Halomonas piscis]|uniref:hypothetical protein n=1 Tax=Halomonas piscis TaxID=3031727 RepID=UPI0028A23E28|nr:hypothetical protein [Halomonas piscis]
MTTQTNAPARPGWYWVKTDDWEKADWEAARWDGCDWHATETDTPWSPATLHTVGPRIPTPDEPWKPVPATPTPNMLEHLGYENSLDGMADWQKLYSAAPQP